MASPSNNIDLEVLAATWRDFQNRMSGKFRKIETERQYQAMVDVLDELVDEIGDRESHSMIGLLDIVSCFVHDYEDRTTEISNSEPHSALQFFMEQHNLRGADLAGVFGSHSNVGDVLSGKREINSTQANTLAARFMFLLPYFSENFGVLNESITKSQNANCEKEILASPFFGKIRERRCVSRNQDYPDKWQALADCPSPSRSLVGEIQEIA